VPFRLLIAGRVKADYVIGLDGLVLSILAGEQKLLKDVQIWRGDQRLA
jgi:hypothetical protein